MTSRAKPLDRQTLSDKTAAQAKGDSQPWAGTAVRNKAQQLYAVSLVMPISGYLLSVTGRISISHFGLFTVPGIGPAPALHKAATSVHLIGQWLVYGLVVLPLLGTSYHVVTARDGTLERILPKQI